MLEIAVPLDGYTLWFQTRSVGVTRMVVTVAPSVEPKALGTWHHFADPGCSLKSSWRVPEGMVMVAKSDPSGAMSR